MGRKKIVSPTDQNNLRTISAFTLWRNNPQTVLTNLLVDSLDQRGFWDNSLQLQLAVIIAAAVVVATVASALISILLQLQLAIVVWLLWTGVGYKTKIQLEWTVICSSSSSRRLLMLPPRSWEQWGGGSKAVPTWAKEFSFSLEVEVELKLRPKLSELCRRSRLKKLIALMTVS